MTQQIQLILNNAGIYSHDTVPTTENALKANGYQFTVKSGTGYPPPIQFSVVLTFDEGLLLLKQLVTASRQHHDAVTSRLVETGQLANLETALNAADVGIIN